MKHEKTNGFQAMDRALALAQPVCDGAATSGDQDELSALPPEFGGIYQAGYEAGLASGLESGYRRGYETGFGDGRRQGDASSAAAPAAVENASESVARMCQRRLFGLPCTKCRRLMYSDEAKCPYCKAPREKLGEPPSATSCRLEEVHRRGPDGGLEQ